MSIVATLREKLLAVATGAGSAAYASYLVSRQVWYQAHDTGIVINEAIEDLRDLQGYERQSQPQPAPIVGPFERQLRLEFASAWNAKVMGFYDFARRWLL